MSRFVVDASSVGSAAPHKCTTHSTSASSPSSSSSHTHIQHARAASQRPHAPTYTAQCVNATSKNFVSTRCQNKISPGTRARPARGHAYPSRALYPLPCMRPRADVVDVTACGVITPPRTRLENAQDKSAHVPRRRALCASIETPPGARAMTITRASCARARDAARGRGRDRARDRETGGDVRDWARDWANDDGVGARECDDDGDDDDARGCGRGRGCGCARVAAWVGAHRRCERLAVGHAHVRWVRRPGQGQE
mmetsp:Transcript_7686/g.25824  ORF Transcript_7686/g.25824 Transcript_7686/m.25824 type:complete len:254 (-) Transcript_7686:1308-2069(-)